MPSFGCLEKEIVSKLLHLYTKRSKNVISTSLPADSDPSFGYLPIAPPLPTIEMDTSTL